MYFVVNKANLAGICPSVFGPFANAEEAIAVAEKNTIAGEYLVCGPAEAVHSVTITAPTVTSTPL